MGAIESGFIGQSVKRKEDARFLTGTGQYTDDVAMPNQTHAYFLRSPHAHARIRSIDTSKAKQAPGVIAVYTSADLEGVNGLPCGWLITDVDGTPMNEPPHPVLAKGKVRYVGDQVALVVAETRDQAKDAAELIDVDDGVRAGPSRAQGPRDRARRWRRLRLEDLSIRRRNGDGVGVEAREPADQVGGRAQRIVSLRCARPRSRHACRARDGQGRQVS